MDDHVIVIMTVLILGALEFGRRGLGRIRVDRAMATCLRGFGSREAIGTGGDQPGWVAHTGLRALAERHRIGLLAVGSGLLAGAGGLRLLGPLGTLAGAAVGAALPHVLRGRQVRKRRLDLERQLADVAESTAMAARSGLSIGQALAFAAEEAVHPMSGILVRFIREHEMGTPFEAALRRFGEGLGTSDAHLFALIVSIHARSGGNLATALDEVASTIRHRIAVRRELRALSAQGRISGSILGALPLGFFLVLAATSHSELVPVYRSAPGLAMILSGLVMEALAFLWIRRLLRVEP